MPWPLELKDKCRGHRFALQTIAEAQLSHWIHEKGVRNKPVLLLATGFLGVFVIQHRLSKYENRHLRSVLLLRLIYVTLGLGPVKGRK